MRISKHGTIGEKAERLFTNLENLLGVELYIRCPSEYAKKIKVNAFKYLPDRNGKQTMVFYIKGEGKYYVRASRSLTEEEIEKIKQYLIAEGFIEAEEEKVVEESVVETPVEIKTEEKQKRKRRKFAISKQERRVLIEMIIEELIEKEGEKIRDFITKVKKGFEDFANVKNYPYSYIWSEIKNLANTTFEITKINNRLFRVRRREINVEAPSINLQAENVIKLLVGSLRNLSFVEVLQLKDYLKNMPEEDKKILRNFIKLMEDDL
jgi:hypothetical protein